MPKLTALLPIVLVSTWAFAAPPAKKELPADIVAEVKASHDEKAPETVTGIVFLDANANGKQDAGEEGIAGVAVTDGVSIVETAADGAYEITIKPDATIPWTPARTVSVSWPDGHWPVGKHWHRLSDIPEGTNAHFALRKDVQTLPFAFSHVTDDHSSGSKYIPFGKDLPNLRGLPRFVVDTGDILYANYSPGGPAIATYRALMRSIESANLPIPMLFVPGNHDNTGTNTAPTVIDRKDPLFCHGVYTKFLGPVRWSFSYGGCHFIGIDWKKPSADGNWQSIVPQEAVDWMKKDLARIPKAMRVFQFVHFPTGVPEYYKVVPRISYTFGGHGHRVEQYYYGGPSITGLNLKGATSSNICIVTEKDFLVVNRCVSCKTAHGYHSKLCGIRYRTRTMPQRLGPVRGTPQPLEPGDLGSKTVDGKDKGIEIEVSIDVGSAKRTGVKIGNQEVVFDGENLHVAGIAIPFKPWPEQKNVLDLHIAACENMLIVYANGLIRTHKPTAVGDASKVTVFAEGGKAKLLAGKVTPLKAGVVKVLVNLGYKQ